MMKLIVKLYFTDDNNEKFFGEGPYQLLLAIEKHHSLSAAAKSMDMAYSKAVKLINRAEEVYNTPLITRATGGRDGGGSVLTDFSRELVQKYGEYKKACNSACKELYNQIFAG